MRTSRCLLAACVLLAPCVSAAEETWYRAPTLAVMTGFIYEPLKPYPIEQWEKGLGSRFDADCWVADFKQAGATYLIFYDKWIDGFVFHDTKTTKFKTRRDFVREVSDACHRGNLRLVYYFNAVSDGNPEFDPWAVRDRRGNFIVFSPNWPTRYQTLHSPFRKISVEQVRELLCNYGRTDGLWLDIFGEQLQTTSPWVAQGYKKMYGRPFDQAAPQTLAEFNARTLAGYHDEVRAIAQQHQPGCVWTSNGAAPMMLEAGDWARRVGARLEYGSVEGHSFDAMDRWARMAWLNFKPIETGLLLSSSWFTPLEDKAPPAAMSDREAIAAAAVALCQGATVYLALTPDHSGVFGEDLRRAKAVGAWFKSVAPLLTAAQPYADVGIVLGAPAADGPGLPYGNSLWKRYLARQSSAFDEAIAVSDALGRAGVFSRLLYASPQGGSWGESLAGYRAIVLPECAPLDDAHADRLRQYVRSGGRLVAFGHASMLDGRNARRGEFALADVFGARYRGEVTFPAKAHGVQVKADSEYSPDFAAENLVDDLPTDWASGGTPMPHWIEIVLSEPADVAAVEVVNRQGPYQIADLDITANSGGGSNAVASVRGATTRQIVAKLEKPVRAHSIRVKILRELFEGKDRQYADVEEIRVLDTAGRNLACRRPAGVPVVATSDALGTARSGAMSFPPMALEVEPTTAEVLARLETGHGAPAVLRNRCGRGEAIWIAASEAAFRGSPGSWPVWRQLAVGKPTFACNDEARDRYRFILTRAGNAHVLHAIDRAVPGTARKPAPLTVSLELDRLGGPRQARLVGAAGSLLTKRDGARLILEVRPDPVATVVLE